MTGPLHRAFHHRLRRRAARLAARVVPHLPPAALLDIGSGTGHNAAAPRAAGDRACVEADVVDFHAVGGGPIVFDGTRLPFADGAFDACLFTFVLRCAADPAGLLREAGREASGLVVILHSCPRGRAGRMILRARGWVQGALAFRICSILGLSTPAPAPMGRRRLPSREAVAGLADAAGLRLARFEPDPAGPRLVGRDLFVLGRRPEEPRP